MACICVYILQSSIRPWFHGIVYFFVVTPQPKTSSGLGSGLAHGSDERVELELLPSTVSEYLCMHVEEAAALIRFHHLHMQPEKTY